MSSEHKTSADACMGIYQRELDERSEQHAELIRLRAVNAELLEALEVLSQEAMGFDDGYDPRLCRAIDGATTAIAKAKGEPQ